MERPSDEGAGSVRKKKNFLVQTEQTRLIRLLLYGFWFIFSSLFSSSDVAVYLTSELVVLLHVYSR